MKNLSTLLIYFWIDDYGMRIIAIRNNTYYNKERLD